MEPQTIIFSSFLWSSAFESRDPLSAERTMRHISMLIIIAWSELVIDGSHHLIGHTVSKSLAICGLVSHFYVLLLLLTGWSLNDEKCVSITRYLPCQQCVFNLLWNLFFVFHFSFYYIFVIVLNDCARRTLQISLHWLFMKQYWPDLLCLRIFFLTHCFMSRQLFWHTLQEIML